MTYITVGVTWFPFQNSLPVYQWAKSHCSNAAVLKESAIGFLKITPHQFWFPLAMHRFVHRLWTKQGIRVHEEETNDQNCQNNKLLLWRKCFRVSFHFFNDCNEILRLISLKASVVLSQSSGSDAQITTCQNKNFNCSIDTLIPSI